VVLTLRWLKRPLSLSFGVTTPIRLIRPTGKPLVQMRRSEEAGVRLRSLWGLKYLSTGGPLADNDENSLAVVEVP
jgi:hypothetical protein